MTLRRSATRAKSRWTLLVTAVAIFSLALVTGALAVHDEGVFQLDGNAIVDTSGDTEPQNPVSDQDGDHDWDEVYADHLDGTTTSGATAIAFFDDEFGQGDDILVGGGTKDINDIGPSWLWKQTAVTSVQDKADIEHAYAAQYTSGEDELLYFGADRFSNSGDTVMGFWFFKSEIATVGPDASGNGTFTGNHTARVVDPETDDVISRGDVLVVADFRSGGKAPSIQVYEWVTSGGSASTHLDQIGGSEDPAGCTESPPEKPNGEPIPPVGDGDPFCATANQFEVQSPWPFTPKANSGGMAGDGGPDTLFGVAEFMEGGINLTSLGLADQCFSTFMAETRASHSVTSTLSDFALGGFGACESGITTTPQAAGENIPAGGASIGTDARVPVTDLAEIEVTGTSGDFDGTVTFYLCGPLALDSTSNCETGGVQIGDPIDVVGTGGSASLESDEATLTSAGRYCWRAEYSGDEEVGVPPSSDPSDDENVSECFKVNPVQPMLDTTAGADVTLTNPITDTADLTGTAKQPGDDGIGPGGTINATAESQEDADGTITWTVFGPDSCVASGLTVTGSPATVSGDDTYGPVSATPTAIGTYYFAASYSGDSPNTLDVSHNGDCSDSDQEVTVTGTASLTTAQDWLPNDTATLTGDTNLTGDLTFELYNDGSCGDDGGTVQYDETIEVNDAASGDDFSTSNGSDPLDTFLVTEANDGSYSWLVTYVDDVLDSPDPSCVEVTSITIDDDNTD